MLRDIDVSAMLAVRDMGTARGFYEGTLGLEPAGAGEEGMVTYLSGKSSIVVYESAYAGTNQANALAWSVGDEFDAIVNDLKSKGVTFERYDLPGLSLEGDVHVAENFKGAWFKDPDGNILHINGR